MHTIRIKELKGLRWIEVSDEAFELKERAEEVFRDYVSAAIMAEQHSVSITWSEGKKVLGLYRIV